MSETVAEREFKHLIDRILRCREAEDEAKEDTKQVYADAKGRGYDKTAMGALVNELRKRDKNPDKFEEASTILDLYRDAYGRASGTKHAIAHTHEELPPHDRDTGELIEDQLQAGSPSRGAVAPSSAGIESSPANQIPNSSAPSSPEQANKPEAGSSLASGTLSAMTARTKGDVIRLLRPHCVHPDDLDLCGGQGTKHCLDCSKAAAGQKVEAA